MIIPAVSRHSAPFFRTNWHWLVLIVTLVTLSGYGGYGRHNREYNRHELSPLLDYCGFDIDLAFSADVHENVADGYTPIAQVADLLKHREYDLGQYLFVRAINARPAKARRPGWLYRSYPAGELEP